jgi:hypothetical protein
MVFTVIIVLFFIGLGVLVVWGIKETWQNKNPSKLPWEQ